MHLPDDVLSRYHGPAGGIPRPLDQGTTRASANEGSAARPPGGRDQRHRPHVESSAGIHLRWSARGGVRLLPTADEDAAARAPWGAVPARGHPAPPVGAREEPRAGSSAASPRPHLLPEVRRPVERLLHKAAARGTHLEAG